MYNYVILTSATVLYSI